MNPLGQSVHRLGGLLLVALSVLTMNLLLISPNPASAAPSSDEAIVCHNEKVVSFDSNGIRISDADFARIVELAGASCNDSGAMSTTHMRNSYGYVAARISSLPGSMSISGYAAGIPNDGKRHELSCTYKSSGGAWRSCGYGTGVTSITTSASVFCLPKGILYTAKVGLYANGSLKTTATKSAYSK